MTIAVVTPWRDHPDLAEDYFRAIDVGKPDQLVIIDDGSEKPLSFAAERIEASGFCAASNRGLDLVETDAVLFLNNDVSPLSATWLESIREAVEPGVIVGPLIFQNMFGPVDHPYVDGWCAAMTTEDARKIRWDERYDKAGPSYFSDNAFSLVARLEGMTLREHRPGLLHKGGQTGGIGTPLFESAIETNKKLWEQQVAELVG